MDGGLVLRPPVKVLREPGLHQSCAVGKRPPPKNQDLQDKQLPRGLGNSGRSGQGDLIYGRRLDSRLGLIRLTRALCLRVVARHRSSVGDIRTFRMCKSGLLHSD